MTRDAFTASLARLESLTKGQLYHTPSDSNPGTWAGSGQTDQNEHDDGIDDNGTDYNGVKKALADKVAKSKALTPAEVAIVQGHKGNCRKSIAKKVAKGQKLTQAESWAVKGGFPFGKDADGDDEDEDMDKTKKSSTAPSKAAGASGEDDDAKNVPETNAGGDTDDEIEPDAKKSLNSAIAKSTKLANSINMSPVLYEFASVIGEALQGGEARTVSRIVKALETAIGGLAQRVATIEKSFAGFSGEQDSFNKSFAEAMLGIGQQLVGSTDVAVQQAGQPVGGPKSHLRAVPGGNGVQPIQKSFGPGGLDTSTEQMNKSQIMEHMFALVQKGQLNQLDAIKFDATGEMSPAVRQRVAQHMGGAA